jgi:hypothetical protein
VRVRVGYGGPGSEGSNREHALHLRRLELAFGTLPVSIDVGGHLERRVAKMAREPRDLGATLQRALCKCV